MINTVPLRFVSITFWYSSSEHEDKEPPFIPALFTRMSIVLFDFISVLMALFMESTLELSTTMPVTEFPLADFFIS